ncbi:MAG: O-methyltransferase [Egibacteraceae bacterium]
MHAVEAERARLLADWSEFDDRDGSVTVATFTRRVSKDAAWCRLLHTLTAHLAPSTVVEMGTGVGISGAAIATALPQDSLTWTVDLRPESGKKAREVFDRVGVFVFVVTGRFDEVLEEVLLEAEPIDLLFVDGHHEQQATLDYTEQAAQYLSDRAVVVYDDIHWSEGMTRAWAAIRSQDRWSFTADLGAVGVCALSAPGRLSPSTSPSRDIQALVAHQPDEVNVGKSVSEPTVVHEPVDSVPKVPEHTDQVFLGDSPLPEVMNIA